jgi:polar amino acid transport system substrate-binding protein
MACALTMGWDPWEPYHYLEPGGEERGLDVELVQAIASRAGCEVDFVRDSWVNLLRRVADGEVDLISGATRTSERDAYALFSEPYRQEAFVLFTRTADAARFGGGTLADKLAAGMRIGVTDAFIYGDDVEALRDDPDFADQFISAEIGETNVTRLMNGDIDGFLEDRFVAAAILRRKGLEGDIAGDLVIASADVRLMFSRASVEPELVERINDSMGALRGSGEFDAIQARYLR